MTVAESSCPVGISEVERPILSIVSGDVPDEALGVEELGSRIVGLAGRLAAGTCRWLLLVSAFDARDGWARFGLGSTARWLTHYCGVSRRTAFEHVRVARVLAAHEGLAAAMGAGRLSYSQVRAISRIADAGDKNLVTDLIEVAEHGTIGQLEDMVRGLRTVDHNQREDAAAAAEQPAEYVSGSWGWDSRWRMNARLDPENGALVASAIDTIARRENLTHTQALVRIAEIALATPTDTPAPTLRGDEQAAVLIRLDAAAVPPDTKSHPDPAPPRGARAGIGSGAGSASGGAEQCSAERAEQCSAEHSPTPIPTPSAASPRLGLRPGWPYARIAGGPGLPERVVHRLLCAGRIRTLLCDQSGSPLDLGRTHRVVSDKLFRALLLRDCGCSHPGCGSRHGLEAHHVRHWLHGGRTDLRNLVLLCRRHHHAHHDGEFLITATRDGRFRYHRADGRELPERIDPTQVADPATNISNVEDEHADVHNDAAMTRWDGQPLDRHYAIATLAPDLYSSKQMSA